MTEYRWIGNHAEQISIGDKRVPVAPGDFVELSTADAESSDNSIWLESGLLLVTGTAAKKEGGE